MAENRIERLEVRDGLRVRIVEHVRTRYPPKPIRRTRSATGELDPDGLFVRLDDDHARMSRRILREGARGLRRWSTIRRHAGPELSPIEAETELLDDLCRHCGLVVVDNWRTGRWVPQSFTVDVSVRAWLGILDPDALRAELTDELTDPRLRDVLEAGPPPGVDWRSFAFVLRAVEHLVSLERHGIRPGARELAGLVDHTKAWTPRRRSLVERILGRPFDDVVAPTERQIDVRGPLEHAEGAIWASAVGSIDLRVVDTVRGLICVENLETFRTLLPLALDGWIVLRIPGGPPPAECELVSRLVALWPGLPVHAAFDLDPAGIRIAVGVGARSGGHLEPTGMTPELLRAAPRHLPLTDWDRTEIERLAGRAGPFESLRAAIAELGAKAEQEPLQRRLLDIFRCTE